MPTTKVLNTSKTNYQLAIELAGDAYNRLSMNYVTDHICGLKLLDTAKGRCFLAVEDLDKRLDWEISQL